MMCRLQQKPNLNWDVREHEFHHSFFVYPIGSMYGVYIYIKLIFTYIYHKNQPHVGKYTIYMDPLGMGRKNI